mmetsp:Transcript_39852/g.85038  ORF Transcript_39852/g.85038 Transcript_39852/m.85038 type:complete len:339 (-) Transcript_39852:1144-2160(-)
MRAIGQHMQNAMPCGTEILSNRKPRVLPPIACASEEGCGLALPLPCEFYKHVPALLATEVGESAVCSFPADHHLLEYNAPDFARHLQTLRREPIRDSDQLMPVVCGAGVIENADRVNLQHLEKRTLTHLTVPNGMDGGFLHGLQCEMFLGLAESHEVAIGSIPSVLSVQSVNFGLILLKLGLEELVANTLSIIHLVELQGQRQSLAGSLLIAQRQRLMALLFQSPQLQLKPGSLAVRPLFVHRALLRGTAPAPTPSNARGLCAAASRGADRAGLTRSIVGGEGHLLPLQSPEERLNCQRRIKAVRNERIFRQVLVEAEFADLQDFVLVISPKVCIRRS